MLQKVRRQGQRLAQGNAGRSPLPHILTTNPVIGFDHQRKLADGLPMSRHLYEIEAAGVDADVIGLVSEFVDFYSRNPGH